MLITHCLNWNEYWNEYTFGKITSRSSGSITGLDSQTQFEITGKGTLNFMLPDDSFLTLTGVQYVPSCNRNLISISKATLHGVLFRFLHNAVHLSWFSSQCGVWSSLQVFIKPSSRYLSLMVVFCMRHESLYSRLGHPSSNLKAL